MGGTGTGERATLFITNLATSGFGPTSADDRRLADRIVTVWCTVVRELLAIGEVVRTGSRVRTIYAQMRAQKMLRIKMSILRKYIVKKCEI